MTDLEDLREELGDALASYAPPPPQPLDISPWVAMSLMQKAIRRGRRDLALQAAATLDPQRLWRRLGIIAYEDVGLGDLHTASLVTAALVGKSYRTHVGGDWKVAAYLVSQLCASPKCRAADDLSWVVERHPAVVPARLEQSAYTIQELLGLIGGPANLTTQAAALKLLLGRSSRGSQVVFDRLAEVAGCPFVAVAQENYRRTGEPLAPLVGLLSLQPGWQSTTTDDPMPPEIDIGGVPSWAYDMFTRQGRATLAAFLGTDAKTAKWIKTHVLPAQRLETLGTALCFVEGGLLNNRLRWPVGDELRRQAEVKCLIVPDASGLLGLLRADIPILDDLRRHHCGDTLN